MTLETKFKKSANDKLLCVIGMRPEKKSNLNYEFRPPVFPHCGVRGAREVRPYTSTFLVGEHMDWSGGVKVTDTLS